jgi:hypothetical protein
LEPGADGDGTLVDVRVNWQSFKDHAFTGSTWGNSTVGNLVSEAGRAAATWTQVGADVRISVVQDDEAWVGYEAQFAGMCSEASTDQRNTVVLAETYLEAFGINKSAFVLAAACSGVECLLTETDAVFLPWAMQEEQASGRLHKVRFLWKDHDVSNTNWKSVGTLEVTQEQSLGAVLQHEFGHMLGLGDQYERPEIGQEATQWNASSLMGSPLGGTVKEPLPAVDCRALWWLYGADQRGEGAYPSPYCEAQEAADDIDWVCSK